MTSLQRTVLFLAGAATVFCIVVAGMRSLPAFGNYAGPYGNVVMSRVVDERHTGQGVCAVTFDYRGFDTMGEEFILFAAVAGVLMLLRREKDEGEQADRDATQGRVPSPPGAAVHMLGTILFPVGLTFGIAMVLHGHLTPGGGFQGGVFCATAFLFLYLTGERSDFERFAPDPALETAEAIGAAGYLIAGLVGIAGHGLFLENVLPLAQEGKLWSAGLLPILNLAVGLEVASGIMLILAAFLRQALQIRKGARP